MRQQGARSRNQQSNKRMSWKAADARQNILDKYGRTAGCQVVLEMGSTQCRARIEQADAGDAIKFETF